LSWPSSSCSVLRLGNKQFLTLTTVCTDSASVFTFTPFLCVLQWLWKWILKSYSLCHMLPISLSNAQLNPRVNFFMSRYLIHQSSLLAKLKNHYHLLTDVKNTGAIQQRKFELLQFNTSTTFSEKASLQQTFSLSLSLSSIYIYNEKFIQNFS
jgi:hypothetical protein